MRNAKTVRHCFLKLRGEGCEHDLAVVLAGFCAMCLRVELRRRAKEQP
jgi:hypothetical protein